MIKINDIKIGDGNPLVLIAGPCVIESKDTTISTAKEIYNICSMLDIPFIFKSSFKKANRTNINSFTGIAEKEALRILALIRKELKIPVLTDIHTNEEAIRAAQVADVIQIPAFLCRQTDLLIAAGKTGRIVNIKKGQFLAPEDMKHAAEKIESTGNNKIMLTERGSSFGYHNLVVDMRSLVVMKELGYPVVMDATHSVQQPGRSSVTGGQPKYILPLAKAAAAVGIDALFLEVHPDPKNALSDSESQLPLNELKNALVEIIKIDRVVKGYG